MLDLDWLDIDSMGTDGALGAAILPLSLQTSSITDNPGGTGTLFGNFLQRNLATLTKTAGQFASAFATRSGAPASAAAAAPQIIVIPGATAPSAQSSARPALVGTVATAVVAAVAVALIVKKRR